MIIRPATYQDSDDLFSWRNDPQTRVMSITSDEVSRSDHDGWYSATLSNPKRILFIGELDDNKIGMCRFDIGEDKGATVSINLNPLMRGKGLSVEFLKRSIDTFWEVSKIDLNAMIKHDNTASIKCFEKAGFCQKSSDENFHEYTLKYKGMQL